MKELIPVRFQMAPDGKFKCSRSGDMSGVYYQAADAQQVIDDLCNRVDTLIAIVREMGGKPGDHDA